MRKMVLAGAVGVAAMAAGGALASVGFEPSHQTGPGRRSTRAVHPGNRTLANLSWKHPDYGCTVEEHEERKRMRAAGDAPFTPKEELGRRRGALARSVGL